MAPPRRPDVTGLELIGGPEPVAVTLHEPDPRWSGVFRDHARAILAAVTAPGAEVEHIGSTAVPGLPAKPIVDILLTVPDITAEEEHVEPLVRAGYVLRVREPRHRMVRTPARDVHVHVYERGDPAIAEYRLLRDHLRTDAADRELYARTKRDLLARHWDDMNDYADAKTAVITAIKARARARHPEDRPHASQQDDRA